MNDYEDEDEASRQIDNYQDREPVQEQYNKPNPKYNMLIQL